MKRVFPSEEHAECYSMGVTDGTVAVIQSLRNLITVMKKDDPSMVVECKRDPVFFLEKFVLPVLIEKHS